MLVFRILAVVIHLHRFPCLFHCFHHQIIIVGCISIMGLLPFIGIIIVVIVISFFFCCEPHKLPHHLTFEVKVEIVVLLLLLSCNVLLLLLLLVLLLVIQ